ncbi:MAG: hypothetical protein ACKOX3_05650 [Bacteroidota bacterium]
MKKSILLAVIMFMFVGLVKAQTSESVAKGMHGGAVFGKGDLKFEYVEKGSDVLVYPMDGKGGMLKTVPVSATVTVVPMAAKLVQEFKNVEFKDGCFKVTRDNVELPVYVVAISTTYNDKVYDAKYVVPNVQAR